MYACLVCCEGLRGQGVSGGGMELQGSPWCLWICDWLLGDVAVVGIGDGPNLRDGSAAMIFDGTPLRYGTVAGIGDGPFGGNVVGATVGRDVASIPCRVLMACICSSPTANGDAGAGLLSAFARSSTAWRAVSVDQSFGTGQLCGKNQLY